MNCNRRFWTVLPFHEPSRRCGLFTVILNNAKDLLFSRQGKQILHCAQDDMLKTSPGSWSVSSVGSADTGRAQ